MSEPSTGQVVTRQLDLGTGGADAALRVLVKECLGIEGIATRCGSAAFADAPPETGHSAIVERLIAAGARITGTVTMHELAFGVSGVNAFAGTAVNPRWPDRIPGGSSSGSAAAVAAGLCDFSIGTDTGGSVRQPACCCGVYGLKPTLGAIDRRGAIPRGSSLDVIGPFAASPAMLTRAAAMMIPGFAPATVDAPRLARIAVDADDEVAAALDAALAPFDPPVIALPSFEAAQLAGLTIINAELAGEFGQLARSDAALGPDVRARLLAALEVTPDQVAEAETVRARFAAEVDAALEGVDALVLPTMPCVPPTLAEAADPAALIPLTRLVRPFNLSGHPALTIPLTTDGGLPAGLQLVARKGAEAVLCALAESLALTAPQPEFAA
ncbi:amidase [Mangrovicoccus algicola]|uniref:Amidase n=1 Tax=Mangrovicoccus algicola TaxID=2771008 RepID=A0A8J6Z2N5_9RHOB|nr:amidase [Mangrovicoccus algicola]MBE3640598.1 amidase [Mangrovicoccus algicola]